MDEQATALRPYQPPADDQTETEGARIDITDDGRASLDRSKCYDSPERLAEYDRETVSLVSAMEEVVTELEADAKRKKDLAKEAKDKQEVGEAELRALIRDRRANRGQPPKADTPSLFPDPEAGESHWAAEPDPREPSEVPAPAEDDSWKALSVNELVACGLAQKTADLLAGQHGLDTLGRLNEYTAPNGGGYCRTYADLEGIGPRTAEKIADAWMEFWRRRDARRAAGATPTRRAGEGGADDPDPNAGEPGDVEADSGETVRADPGHAVPGGPTLDEWVKAGRDLGDGPGEDQEPDERP